MFGGVSMVDGLNQQLRAELGESTRIIATGGLAKVFLPHFKTVEAIEPNLTLYGLQLIFERCRPQTK
jgi:type III pantothenate kinase